MKKIIYILTIFIISMSVSIAQNTNEEFNEALNKAFDEIAKEQIESYKKMANCISYDQKIMPMRISNGYCIYSRMTTEHNGITYPLDECMVPMEVIKEYSYKKIEELNQGIFQYDSSTDPLNKYCRKKTVKIKTDYGEVTYN